MRFLQKEIMMIEFKKPFINRALERLGFTELTDVQEKVIPVLQDRKDIIAEANTGSGKTHAFLLPIFEAIDPDLKQIQALILAPTRELANQIYNFATVISGLSEKPINVDLFVGGIDRQDIITRLESRMPHIAIGTPGRITDLAIKENLLKVYTANFLIIDEADMTLDGNFIEEVANILSIIQDNCVKAVFSATIPESLRPFLKKYLKNPIMIDVHPQDVSSLNIEHYFIKTRETDKFVMLKKIVEAINPYLAVIFCNTKESAESVFEWMKDRKAKVTLVHGGIDYRKRRQLMKRINSLEFQYIVATDIFARGIDVIGISHIINFELPKNMEFYIHRTGRTGRIDFTGIAVSLYEFADNSYLDYLEKKGIRAVYKEIRDNQIIDARVRKSREKRDWKENDLDRQAKSKVRKPKQVKPGYKKKYKEEVAKVRKQLARKKH